MLRTGLLLLALLLVAPAAHGAMLVAESNELAVLDWDQPQTFNLDLHRYCRSSASILEEQTVHVQTTPFPAYEVTAPASVTFAQWNCATEGTIQTQTIDVSLTTTNMTVGLSTFNVPIHFRPDEGMNEYTSASNSPAGYLRFIVPFRAVIEQIPGPYAATGTDVRAPIQFQATANSWAIAEVVSFDVPKGFAASAPHLVQIDAFSDGTVVIPMQVQTPRSPWSSAQIGYTLRLQPEQEVFGWGKERPPAEWVTPFEYHGTFTIHNEHADPVSRAVGTVGGPIIYGLLVGGLAGAAMLVRRRRQTLAQ